ncbi:hypothetical protein OHB12_21075 [Nocardia sp. NBC_01730]|uniref:hypothetical protein n=1 Tax=Nocardia sp. NBC_01730 TaxID=2975998 RepID=UPI002E14D11C|nr:hypothetical protein OHB12_21075 [Nocardia sp. NBC_01730]
MTVIDRVRGVGVPYAECIDHDTTLTTYLCPIGALGIPTRVTSAVTVLGDMNLVHAAVRDPAARFGAPQRIVPVHELMPAAGMRVEFDIPCARPEYFMWFRDKSSMADAIAAQNVSSPEFRDAPDKRSVTEFAANHRFPIIVEPRLGGGSRDVVNPDSAAVDVRHAHAPYRYSIPQVGSVITEKFGYAEIRAAFRFRGSSSVQVLEFIQRTVERFRMVCAALDSPAGVAGA